MCDVEVGDGRFEIFAYLEWSGDRRGEGPPRCVTAAPTGNHFLLVFGGCDRHWRNVRFLAFYGEFSCTAFEILAAVLTALWSTVDDAVWIFNLYARHSRVTFLSAARLAALFSEGLSVLWREVGRRRF